MIVLVYMLVQSLNITRIWHVCLVNLLLIVKSNGLGTQVMQKEHKHKSFQIISCANKGKFHEL